jgi:hypothetical protein
MRCVDGTQIMADATEVAPTLVGEEDVGAEVDGLREALEAAASARQLSQIHGAIYRDEYIGVLRDRLGRRQRAHECDAQHAPTVAGSPHEGADGEKRPARLGYWGRGTVGSVAVHNSMRGLLVSGKALKRFKRLAPFGNDGRNGMIEPSKGCL